MFNTEPVNIFFSCDDGYVPFMSVALGSLKENCDMWREYNIKVIHTGISDENIKTITETFNSDGFNVEFVNIENEIKMFMDRFHTRDYYSKTTYYRIFIPDLFPELDKALYIDSDIVVNGDISRLYDIELNDNLVGAVPENFVNSVDELKLYATNRVGVRNARYYFNAGVLLMNLKEMREFDLSGVFLKLLNAVTFTVAQDQDYLNIICKDRVRYIGREWNTAPNFGCLPESDVCIAHYIIDRKPWHRDDVQYGDLFWDYANRSVYSEEIRRIRREYSEENIEKSALQTKNLIKLAYSEAMDKEENDRIEKIVKQIVPKAEMGILSRCYRRFFSPVAERRFAFFR